MARRWTRRAGWTALAVAVVLLGALLLLETPFVRARAIAWALGELDRRFGIVGQIDDLNLSPLRLAVELRGVELATRRQPDTPFVVLDEITIDLPRSVLGGTVRVDTVAVSGGRLVLVNDGDGWNVPGGGGGSARGAPVPWPSERLRLDGFGVEVRTPRMAVAAPALAVALEARDGALAGTLGAEAPIDIRWGDRATTIGSLAASLAFDGRDVDFASLDATLPEGAVSASGRLVSVLDGPAYELTYDAGLDLSQARLWVAPDLDLDGRLATTGTITGPFGDPVLSVAASGDRVRWTDIEVTDVRAAGELAAGSFVLDTLAAGYSAGELAAEGRLAVGADPATSRLALTWREVEPAALLSRFLPEVPVSAAAAIDGRLDLDWPHRQDGSLGLTAEVRSRGRPTRRGAVSLDGTLRAARRGASWWVASDGVRVAGVALAGRLDGAGATLAGSSVAGRVTAATGDLAGLLAALDRSALTRRAADQDLDGDLAVEADVSGRLDALRLEGTLTATRASYRGVGPMVLTSPFTLEGADLTLDGMAASLDAGQATGRASVNLASGALGGRLDGRLDDVSVLAPALPAGAAPTGSLAVTATLGGTLGAPALAATLESASLGLAGRSFDAVRADVRLDSGTVVVDALDARLGGGTIALAGRYELDVDAYDARASVVGVPLAALAPAAGATGRLDAELAGAGPLRAANAEGTVVVHDLDWGGLHVGRVDGDVTLAAGRLDATLTASALNAAGTIRAGLGADTTFELAADVDGADLAALTPHRAGPPPATGTVSFGVRASGDRTDLATATATVRLVGLDGQLGSRPIHLVSPGTLDYAAGTLGTDRLELELAGTRLTLGGRLGADRSGRLDARLVGDLADLEAVVGLSAATPDAAAARLRLAGDIDLQASLTGALDAPSLSGRLAVRGASIGWDDLPPLAELELTARYDARGLTVDRLAGRWQGTAVGGTATAPPAVVTSWLPAWLAASTPEDNTPARLALSTGALRPAALAPFVEPTLLRQLGGELAATVTLEMTEPTLVGLDGRLLLDRLDLTVAGLPVAQQAPTAVTLGGGRLVVESWRWGGLNNDLSVSGTVDLTGSEPALDLRFDGTGDLRVIGALAAGLATSGRATAELRIGGTLARPELTGSIDVIDGELRESDFGIVVTGMTGSASFDGDRIQMLSFAGEANGGTLDVLVDLELAGRQPVGGIWFIGRGVGLNVPEGLRTEVDADLDLSVGTGVPTLGGNVWVLRGAYREPLATGGLLAAVRGPEQVSIVGIDEPGAFDALALDVRIVNDEDLIVANNVANGEAGLDIRLGGSIGAPAVTGRVAFREGGQVRVANRVYEIRSGTVDFIDPGGIEPQLDLSARTRVSAYEITLAVAGRPDTLTTSFQSDPSLPESDILSLLLTGRTLDDVRVAPGAAARDQVLGLLSDQLLSSAGRSIGLDTVRIAPEQPDVSLNDGLVANEANPGARLTIAKDLSEQVRLIASQNLRESGLFTGIVEYLPRRDLELRFVVDDENDRAYEFRHALSWGAPPRTPRPTAPRAPDRTIGAVVFVAESGDPVDDLEGLASLGVGEPFDFDAWQRDRDRLERHYADRGHLEVHVHARRQEESDGSLTLTYTIAPGPRTILTVTGVELPAPVVDTMKGAWRRAVFDGFLLAELESIVREHLADDGYLQARVTATRAPAAAVGVKEVVVAVEPGARVSASRIEFRGAAQVSPETLAAIVRAGQLETLSWADTEPLARAVQEAYRARGLLEAAVEVGDPERVGGELVLPVTIAEGPVFRVGAVTLAGVAARPEAAVRGLLGFSAGDPYLPARLQEARNRILASYRQAGFNAVRVSLESAVDQTAASVAVGYRVEEGPRQVIEAIEVVGAHRTRPDVVARALALTPGQPADLAEWNRARKRLYDLGVFRSVDLEPEPVGTADDGATERVQVNVLLEEWPAYRWRYGLRVEDVQLPLSEAADRDVRLGFVSDLTRENFLGRAGTLGTALRWDADRRIVRGFATLRTMFGLPVSSNLFLSGRRERVGEPAANRYADIARATLEQRVRPRQGVTVAYSYSFERNHTFVEAVAPDGVPDPGETVDLARLNASLAIDRRDDAFNATRGWFHGSSLEYGVTGLGSDLRFVKFTAQQFHYWPVGHGVVLASAGRIGLGKGFDQELIRSERFFAGGVNTVRGFSHNSLGPTVEGDAVGGNALVVLNQELRFPVWGRLGGAAFVDAGSVFGTVRAIALPDLEVGAGVGLRVDTPFGLFRVDFARPVSDIERSRRRAFFFSFGHVF